MYNNAEINTLRENAMTSGREFLRENQYQFESHLMSDPNQEVQSATVVQSLDEVFTPDFPKQEVLKKINLNFGNFLEEIRVALEAAENYWKNTSRSISNNLSIKGIN